MEKKIKEIAQALMELAEKGKPAEMGMRVRVAERLAALEAEKAQLEVAVNSIENLDLLMSRRGFWKKEKGSPEIDLSIAIFSAKREIKDSLIEKEAIADKLKKVELFLSTRKVTPAEFVEHLKAQVATYEKKLAKEQAILKTLGEIDTALVKADVDEDTKAFDLSVNAATWKVKKRLVKIEAIHNELKALLKEVEENG